MKKYFALCVTAALLALPSLARADVTWTITRNGTKVGEMVLTDAQAARLSAWAITLRKGAIVQTPAVPEVAAVSEVVVDGKVTKAAVPAVPAVPAVMRDPTAAEAAQFLAGDLLQEMRDRATQWHRGEASRTAVDAVAPILPK